MKPMNIDASSDLARTFVELLDGLFAGGGEILR